MSDFDSKASTWDDDPAKVHRATVIAEAIRDSVDVSRNTRVLEYGAGTGLISQALAPHVGPITLADTSAGMRSAMLGKRLLGKLPSRARVWSLDLASEPAPDESFDLIVCAMTLHHIPDVDRVLAGFSALLAEGGALAIVDLEAEDGSFHEANPEFDGHDGFDRSVLARSLEAHGFDGVAFRHCCDVLRNGRDYPLFLAVGRRTAASADSQA